MIVFVMALPLFGGIFARTIFLFRFLCVRFHVVLWTAIFDLLSNCGNNLKIGGEAKSKHFLLEKVERNPFFFWISPILKKSSDKFLYFFVKIGHYHYIFILFLAWTATLNTLRIYCILFRPIFHI